MDIAQKIAITKNLILSAQKSNHFIGVDFIKKSTGELRHMICHRAKVLEATVDPNPSESTLKRKATNKSRNNLCVEEITSEGVHQFRTIPLENIVKITSGGNVCQF